MTQPVNVYIESAEGDKTYRDELAVHLDVLQRQGHIRTWHRGKLIAGDSITATPRASLESAQIVVLLLSPELLSQRHEEMALALSRSRDKRSRVVPVKVRDCDEGAVPELVDRLILREGKCPSDKAARDTWFAEAAKVIRAIVEELRQGNDESPADEDDSPRGKMRTKLKEHLLSVPSIQQKLIEKLRLPKNADMEHLATHLFDKSLPALDLARAFQSARQGLGPSDLLTLQEIARLVLPQSGEVYAQLREWKKELAGRHLLLPYLSHAEAEMALARLDERPYQETLHEAEDHADTKLVSEALSPATEIRSGSAKVGLFEEHFFMQEIARYFATKVKLGANRRHEGKFIYRRTDHPDLVFTQEGNFEKVVNRINDHLQFHQEDAEVADLLTMHIEVDVPDLAERLKDRETADRLLRELGKTFPRLSFVQLAPKPQANSYLRLLLVVIFSKHKPTQESTTTR